MTCNACNRAIYDRLMSKTSPDNKIWHSNCLKCCECNKLLDSKYFETRGRLYCRNDYLTYFGPSCFGCAGKITDEQYFFSIKQQSVNQQHQQIQQASGETTPLPPYKTTSNSPNLFFHDKCFACSYCARPLQKGDKYCIIDTSSNTLHKTLMICHDMCAIKYHSTSIGMANANTMNSDNNTMQSADNALHPTGQQLQTVPPNVPAPRARRGRMKQSL